MFQKKSFYRLFAACFCLAVLAPSARAARDFVPEALEPWIPWVLHGEEEALCPFFQGDEGARECAWPGRLKLDLTASGGSFELGFERLAAGWAELPGDAKLWPQDVRVGGVSHPVLDRDGVPALWLEKGAHEISGTFAWSALPESLPLPASLALLDVSVNGEIVVRPYRDEEGRVWLSRQEKDAGEEDELILVVTRKITDGVPLTLTTRIDVEAAGKAREVLLARPLPEGFAPLSLDSALPARLDADGRLRLQVRPGQWSVRLAARHLGPVDAVKVPSKQEGWVEEEVWAYEAKVEVRVADVSGVPGVDPRQTALPADWKALPAYQVKPGDTVVFEQKSRGNENPEPDRLSLNRTLWLDFDGGGFSFSDEVAALFRRSLRLEMGPELDLGRVSLNGEDQFITTLGAVGRKGIEVPLGRAGVHAEGRGTLKAGVFAVAGWEHDFDEVAGTLKLPPGWSVFAAWDVDRISRTWLGSWTLMDLFLLFVFSLSAGKLWGARWGALSFAVLGLTLTEGGAPRWLWLAVLVTAALRAAVATPRLARFLDWCRRLAVLLFVLASANFAVAHLRQGLFPHLQDGAGFIGDLFYLGGDIDDESSYDMPMAPPLPNAAPEAVAPAGRMMMDEAKGDFVAQQEEALQQQSYSGLASSNVMRPMKQRGLLKKAYSYKLDSNQRVQTGFGLPTWEWTNLRYSFSGPVKQGHAMNLILLSPAVNCALAFLRVLLLLGVIVRVLGGKLPRVPAGPVAAAVFLFFALAASDAHAGGLVAKGDLPSQGLLDQLKERLLEAPECAPECASLPRLDVAVAEDTVTLTLAVDAAAETALPLPGHDRDWRADAVSLDDGGPARVSRDADGFFWLKASPGAHIVTLTGGLPDRNEIRIPLKLKPRRVTVTAPGWQVSGVDAQGVPQENLTLTRTEKRAAAANDEAGVKLPPFAEVERHLTFGLKWEAETTVRRLSALGQPVVLEIPLLPGESVISDSVEIAKGLARVSLGPQTADVSWRSTLPVSETLELKAASSHDWAEFWRVESAPLWHVESSGIPPLHPGQNPEANRVEWRPWPGEAVTLRVSKPAGASGPTATIDKASLEVTLGLRGAKSVLELSVRTSTGGRQTIGLEPGAKVEKVSVNGVGQPVRREGDDVIVPLTPGSQTVAVEWADDTGIAWRYRTPAVKIPGNLVNTTLGVTLPENRWVLWLNGPKLGAVVQFWGLVLLILALAPALARLKSVPLKAWQWALLLAGLSQTSVYAAAFVVLWLVVVGRIGETSGPAGALIYDLRQIGLSILTVWALSVLLEGVHQGLLGLPRMHIEGYGSWATHLRWYQDRSDGALPRACVVSLPILAYHLTMMAWSLWLAVSVIAWVKLAWKNATASGGVWKALFKRA